MHACNMIYSITISVPSREGFLYSLNPSTKTESRVEGVAYKLPENISIYPKSLFFNTYLFKPKSKSPKFSSEKARVSFSPGELSWLSKTQKERGRKEEERKKEENRRRERERGERKTPKQNVMAKRTNEPLSPKSNPIETFSHHHSPRPLTVPPQLLMPSLTVYRILLLHGKKKVKKREKKGQLTTSTHTNPSG